MWYYVLHPIWNKRGTWYFTKRPLSFIFSQLAHSTLYLLAPAAPYGCNFCLAISLGHGWQLESLIPSTLIHPRALEDPPCRPLRSGARNRARALQIAPSFADSQLRPSGNFFDLGSSGRSLALLILHWPSSFPVLSVHSSICFPFPMTPSALTSFLSRRFSPSVALRWTSGAKSTLSRFCVKVFVVHACPRSLSRSGTQNPCSTCSLTWPLRAMLEILFLNLEGLKRKTYLY
jgi:hypothetical protein